MAHFVRKVKNQSMDFLQGRPLLGWYIAGIATLDLLLNLIRV